MANNNIKTKQVVIPIKMNGDASSAINELKKLQSTLSGLEGKHYGSFSPISSEDIENSRKELDRVISIIEKSKNLDGSINPFKFDTYAKKAGLSIDEINNKLKKFGKSTIEIDSVKNSFSKLPKPIEKTETAIEKLGKTIANSFRYNVVNDFMDAIIGAGEDLFSFYDDVDENINNIRIVSGRSASAMDGFFDTAIKGAKAMGETTESYLEASETFYQQGLATNEVMARTEATIKAANVSAQSVGTTADQVTSLLNGFNISANNIVETLDKLAAVGAGTATDFEEIALASQKVASSASQAGFELDDVLGILSTISSVTREAPESIGTSLNAIIGRLNDLKVGDELTSKIQKAFDQTKSGLTLLDEETGVLKDGIEIFEDLGAIWGDLNRNQKAIITTAMAGTRQANRLMSLFNNWDMFETYRDIAKNSTGALEEQNEIYLESLEAIKNQATAAKEEVYRELFDTNAIKDFYQALTSVEETIARIVDGVGGAIPLITNLVAAFGKTAMLNYIGPSITKKMLSLQQNRGTSGAERKAEATALENETKYLKEHFNIESSLTSYRERSLYLTQEQNEEYEASKQKLIEIADLEDKLKSSEDSMFQYENKEGKIVGLSIPEYSESLVKLQKDYASASKNVSEIEKKTVEKMIEGQRKLVTEKKTAYLDMLKINQESQQFTDEELKKAKEAVKVEQEKLKTLKEQAKTKAEAQLKVVNQGGAKELLNQMIKKAQDDDTSVEHTLLKSGFFDELFGDERIKTGEKSYTKLKNLFKKKDFINDSKKQSFLDENAALGVLEKIISKLEEVGTAEAKNYAQILKTYDGQKEKLGDLLGDIKKYEDAMKTARNISYITNAAFGIATLTNAMNALSDTSTTTEEKLQGLTSSIGSFLAMMPGYLGAFGMALSLLGPIFIDVFDIGVSRIEKLNKKLTALTDSYNQLLEPINQQKKDLAPVAPLYETLAKQYEKTAFAFEDLSEEQQGQYTQVAEYIQSYAPELIKYYDAEGRAVLDLSKGYDYLTNSFKNAQAATYEGLKVDVGQSFEDLVEFNKLAKQQNEVLLRQREQLQESLMNSTSAKDIEYYQEQLSSINKRISENTDTLKNFGKNYTSLVVDPLLKSSKVFLDLDSSIQNSFYSLMSLNNVLAVDTDVVDYSRDVLGLVYAISSVTDEAKQRFSEMNDIVREGIFRDLSLAKFNEEVEEGKTGLEKIRSILQDLTEEDYLRGELSFDNKGLIDEQYNAELKAITGELEKQKELVSEAEDSLKNLYNSEDLANRTIKGIESYVNQEDEEIKKALGGALGVSEYNYDYQSQANEYVKAIRRIIEAKEEQKQIEKEVAEFTGDEDKKRQEIAKKMQATYTKTVTDFAASSAESYDRLLKIYEETEKTIGEGDLLDSMKAALNYDNEEYFNAFVEANKEQTAKVEQELGVRVQDYKTYREYTLAIDSAYAKKKQLLEIAITEGVEAANEAKLKLQGEMYVQQLLQDQEYGKASVYLQASDEDRKQLIKLQSSKKQLEAEKQRIQDELDALNRGAKAKRGVLLSEVNDYVDATNKKIEANAKLTGQEQDSVERVTASIFSSATDEDYKAMLLNQQATIQNAITNTDNAIKALTEKIKNQAGYEEDYYNNLIGDFDDFLNNFSYDIEGFGDLTERTGDTVQDSVDMIGDASKSLKEIEFDLDPLRKYILKIEELNHQLELLQEAKEKAYGSKYVNFLKEEAEINRKIIATEQAKLQKINEITKAKQEELSKYGVQFEESGAISNYNELLGAMQSVSATDDEKKAADDLKDKMDKYETYALDKKREAQLAIESSKKALAEIAQEQIEYPIQLIIDANARDMELIDFITETQKLKGGKINLSIDTTSSANKLTSSLGSVQDIFSQLGDVESFVDGVLGNPDLEGDPARQMEILKNQEDNLKELAGSLMQFLEDFENAFYDALDEAMSLFEDVVNNYGNIVNQYEYLISLSNKLGEGGADYAMKAYDQMEKIYRKNMQGYMDMAEIFKDSRDSFEEGTDEWIAANEKYLEAQAGVMEQEKQLAELLGEKYDVTVSSGRKELEGLLFGGMTEEEAKKALDEINEKREKYLDTEEKIYQLSSMEANIQEDIDKYQNNASAQNKLKKFMQDELKYLNSKEKLTKHDIELSEKQFAILKARIEMEEAQNNKQYTQMLQRNADGTFGYMYVLDSEENDKAIQDYKDAIDDLYQYASDRNQDLQKESLEIKSKWLSAYDDITAQLKAGTISEEEAVKKLQEAYDKMIESLKENAKEQAEMQKQMAASKLMQILGVTEGEVSEMDNMNEALKKSFDILANNSEFDSKKLFSNLNLDFSGMEGLSGGDALLGAFDKLGGTGAEQIEKIKKALLDMGETTAATVLSLISQMTNLGDVSDSIFENAIGGSGEGFDSFLDGLTDKVGTSSGIFNESFTNSFNSIGENWGKLQEVINGDIDKFAIEFSSTVSKVTAEVVSAYAKYNEVLEDAVDRVIDNQNELISVTEVLNDTLDDTISKLEDEIDTVTRVRQNYQELRNEVLEAIDRVTDYIKTLHKAQSRLEELNDIQRSNIDLIEQTNRAANNAAKAAEASARAAHSAMDAAERAAAEIKAAARQEAAEIIADAREQAAAIKAAASAAASSGGGSGGAANAGVGAGGKKPSKKSAFHNGGTVGVNLTNEEAMAIVKKNERVLTEEQAKISDRIYENLRKISELPKASNIINNKSTTATNTYNNYKIYADFPNANDARAIEEALLTIDQKAIQYVNRR